MFLWLFLVKNSSRILLGSRSKQRRRALLLGATCKLLSTLLILSRSISNLVKMLIGLFPIPLRPGRPYSNLENWALGLILTPLRPNRPYSNLENWELGLILTPRRPDRPYSNLENWALGLILTPLNPGRPNSNILEVVRELHLIFSNTL